MNRLISLTLSLIVTFAALVTVAGAAGEALTSPGMFSTEGLDCEYPCWQGITPGVTTLAEARRSLARNPFVLPGSVRQRRDELRWLTSAGWSGRAVASEGVIASLDLYGAFALGDLVADLGLPEAVWARYTRDILQYEQVKAWFFYPGAHVALETLGGRPGPPLMTPKLLIRGVYYHGPRAPWRGSVLLDGGAVLWQGFALSRYHALRR